MYVEPRVVPQTKGLARQGVTQTTRAWQLPPYSAWQMRTVEDPTRWANMVDEGNGWSEVGGAAQQKWRSAFGNVDIEEATRSAAHRADGQEGAQQAVR